MGHTTKSSFTPANAKTSAANFTSTAISASFDKDEACGDLDWDDDGDLDDLLNED
jgi:hypothetical protein